MKKIFLMLIAGCAITISSSCKKSSFLDPATEPLTQKAVFSDSTMTMRILADAYNGTGLDIVVYVNSWTSLSPINDNFETLTSNVASGYSAPQSTFLTAGYTSTNHVFNNYYTFYYKKIRETNLFMQNIGSSPLSATMKARTKAEARFLRAFYYAQLVRLYGGVQLVGDAADDALPIGGIYKRNTYKECVDYITSELDAAAAGLPSALTQLQSDYGRATSGACKALKARMLVTAASPLYNGKSISASANTLPLISYSASYDPSLWQKAADACKAVLDLPDYSLVVDNATQPGWGFRKLFLSGRSTPEFIFPFNTSPNNNDLELFWFPRTVSGATDLTYANPTEQIVNSFGMADGKPITAPSTAYPYNANNPYVNRDPRFYHSIIYNQAIMPKHSGTGTAPINIYFDQATNSRTADALQTYFTKTGYYSRKMCDDATPFTNLNIDRAYPVIRLAEMVLGYAEALNEMGQTETAVTYVNQIRNRAGILAGADGRYGIPTGVSQADLRTVIQNEYRVEFFDEGHWYYDTRRWRTAEVTETQLTGTNITKQLNGTFTYASVNVLNPVFTQAMYFAPIPLSEILKSGGPLLQNPGW